MRDEIIKMAREAGISVFDNIKTIAGDKDELERFFHMAQAAEREACAKVCEAWQEWGGNSELLAKAIRARGQA